MGKKKPKRAAWAKRKGCSRGGAARKLSKVLATVEEMVSGQPEVARPVHSNCCFNMQLGLSERNRLIDYLWTGEYHGALGELCMANPKLTHWLAETTRNQYWANNQELHALKQTLKFESMLCQHMRLQNEHIMPLWTVVHSVDAHRTKRDRYDHCT